MTKSKDWIWPVDLIYYVPFVDFISDLPKFVVLCSSTDGASVTNQEYLQTETELHNWRIYSNGIFYFHEIYPARDWTLKLKLIVNIFYEIIFFERHVQKWKETRVIRPSQDQTESFQLTKKIEKFYRVYKVYKVEFEENFENLSGESK